MRRCQSWQNTMLSENMIVMAIQHNPHLSKRTLELDSDDESNASIPELAEHNAEQEHDSDDDSTQPPPLLDRRLQPESDSESEYETGKSQMSMEELSATVEAIDNSTQMD